MRNINSFDMVAKIDFANTKHHRQILRQTIKPQLIHQLQTNGDPALNYKNAYKNIFKDQLQKTMQQLNQKKIKNQHNKNEERANYSILTDNLEFSRAQHSVHQANSISQNEQSHREGAQGIQAYQIKSIDRSSINASHKPQHQQYHQNSKFVDYFQQRTNRFEDYIKNSYNGGSDFYKVQDAYQFKKKQQQQNYAYILKRQINDKQNERIYQKQKENLESIGVKQMEFYNYQLERQRVKKQIEEKEHQKIDKLQQLHEERQRKMKVRYQNKSLSMSMHNPITNPIEFHINNPYILKKIQQQSGF